LTVRKLFYVDNAGPSRSPDDLLSNPNHTINEDDNIEEPLHQLIQDDGRQGVDSRAGAAVAAVLTSKNAAWVDPDDVNIEVSLASDNRLRKLRDAPVEDIVKGRDYEARLHFRYEKVNPAPEWASVARDILRGKKRRRASQTSQPASASGDEDHITSLINSSGKLLSSQKSLPQGQISIERLRDANQSILLTASADRRLRLFNVSFIIDTSLLRTYALIRSMAIPTRISNRFIYQAFPSLMPSFTLAVPLYSLQATDHFITYMT